MIIAIDGPAAAGKGTIALKLAKHYGLNHLDTGLLYRAIGRLMTEQGLDVDNATEADIARLKAFDEGIEQDYAEMRDRLVDDMVPVMLAALERTAQKSAEIDGTFKELIASMRKPG